MSEPNSFQQLDDNGYVLLPDVINANLLGQLRDQITMLFQREGASAGAEFRQEPGSRRLANLVNKGDIFQEIMAHADVLPLVQHVLECNVKLSSMNARSANPHNKEPQPLHCDMGAIPDTKGSWVCNVVWMLDDFTKDNGALRVIPGSHRSNQLPQSLLDDCLADHPQQFLVTGKAGSVIVMNAHLWHGGLANRTDRPRTAIHAFYCRRDKPQQQYQKQLIDAEVQATLSESLRYLLALDDPENDRLARQSVERSGFLRPSPHTD